jgi:hypothetical protein
MRTQALLCGLVVVTACGGGDGSPTGTDGSGNPPPTGPTITSVSPATPYWGDIITIRGTGFGTTPSANHVWFRKLLSLCFSNSDTTAQDVLSASATELRVRVPYNALPLTSLHPQNCRSGSVRLNVAGRSVESAPITFLVPPQVRRWTADGSGTIARGSVGVSIPIHGLAEDPQNTLLTVNGFVIPAGIRTQIGPNPGTGVGSVSFTMPDGASPGGGTSFSDTVSVPVRVTVNGRSADSMMTMRRYPPMRMDSVQSVLVPQATPGAPDSRQVTAFVRNYFGPAEAVWQRATVGTPAEVIGTVQFSGDTTGNGLFSGPAVMLSPDGTSGAQWYVTIRITRFGTGSPAVQLPTGPYSVP